MEKDFYDYAEDGINELPEKLVHDVKGHSFDRVNHERIPTNTLILTDKERIIGIDLKGTNVPVRKSRLFRVKRVLYLKWLNTIQ